MIDDTGPWIAADAGDELGVDYLSNLPKMIALASSGGIHCVGAGSYTPSLFSST